MIYLTAVTIFRILFLSSVFLCSLGQDKAKKAKAVSSLDVKVLGRQGQWLIQQLILGQILWKLEWIIKDQVAPIHHI